ncbi:MAG: AsmA-like C-terminal region-containing protein, partial [Luteibaculum sp.]
IYLQFDLWDLFRKQIDINEIRLQSGALNLQQQKDGSWNYEIWKKDEAEGASAALNFKVDRVYLDKVHIQLKAKESVDIKAYAESANLHDISIENSELNLDFQGRCFHLSSGKDIWFQNQALELASGISWKNKQVTATGELQAGSVQLDFSSHWTEKQWKTTINSNEFSFEALEFFPAIIALLPEELERKGSIKVDGDIILGNELYCSLNIGLKNSAWILSREENAQLANGERISLDMANFRLLLERQVLMLYVPNLRAKYRYLAFEASEGEIKPEDAGTHISFKQLDLKNQEGQIFKNQSVDIQGDLEYKGELGLYIHQDGRLELKPGEGTLLLKNIVDRQSKLWELKNAQWKRSASVLSTDKAEFTVGGNAFNYSGSIDLGSDLGNIIPDINGYLTAESLDVNTLVLNSGGEHAEELDLRVHVDYYIKNLKAGAVDFKENIGKFVWDGHNEFVFRDFRTQLSGGILEGSVACSVLPNKELALSGDVLLDDIGLKSLFQDFNDFGQQAISYKNLDGSLDADLQFSCRLKQDGSLISNSLDANSHVLISQGSLSQLPLFKDLSSAIRKNLITNAFVNVNRMSEALREVQFQNLSNHIVIRSGDISMPKMEIKSNVFNLNASGNHSLDNKIDYHLDFLLSDALRIGKEASSENENGKRIFIRVFGTTDNPQYSLDREAAKKYREEQKKEGKLVFQELFSEDSKNPLGKGLIIEPESNSDNNNTAQQQGKTEANPTKKPKWLRQEKPEKTKVEIDFSEDDL